MKVAQASLLTILALLMASSGALAQPLPSASPVDWIRPEEVPARADALLRRLDAAKPAAAAESSLAKIEASFPQIAQEVQGLLERVNEAIANSASPADLDDLRREITGTVAPLRTWKSELSSEAKQLAESLDVVARSKNTWELTRDRPETAAAGDVVVRRVESSIAALDAAAANLAAWRERVLGSSDRVIERVQAADAALERIDATSAVERASLFVPDSAPLWSRGFASAMSSELPRVPGEIAAYARSTSGYITRDPRPFLVHALLAGLLMFALGRLSKHARTRLRGDDTGARAARLLECPYSAGLLFACLASPFFHPLAPRRFIQLVALIALLPAVRIVVHAAGRAHAPAFVGLFVLLLLDRVELAIAALPALRRATFLLSLTIGLGLAAWASRRTRFGDTAPWLRHAASIALAGLALAILAEIGGWTNLATIVGRGILSGAMSALYIYAATLALAALLAYAVGSPALQRSHLVARRTSVLQRSVERGLPWLAVLVWAYFVLIALGMQSLAAGALDRFLAAGVTVGALSLSVGGVLAFALTLAISLLLARLAIDVLEEDVYPRANLPRGVPYALSTLVRYAVYSLGFLFALAAAGVQFSQVTIMVGGLGIGIGLGLQDLVKNFAAGLTLILERRVNVGDTLEMPSQGIFGHVRAIGMRASVVRTWSGAEVVVPNADLISSAVTNWTLSDRLCRIEVPVGVAYGVDPERVVALLDDAVRSRDHFLATPPPQVLFKGFGESSLDFLVRAWTDQGYDNAIGLTSELGLAVSRALREAGIGIPFPQRDLHLASVSAEVSAALSRSGRRDE